MSDTPAQDTNQPIDFRTAYCEWTGCPVDQFEKRVLAQTLFFQARVLRFIARPFRPHSFHAELVLIKQAGDKQELSDVELDIDFYQHKYVVGKLLRESFNLRVSGRQLLKLARNAFRSARMTGIAQPAMPPTGTKPSATSDHPHPA